MLQADFIKLYSPYRNVDLLNMILERASFIGNGAYEPISTLTSLTLTYLNEFII